MNLESLLYISRSCINPDVAQSAIDEIVSKSVVNNKRCGMTGALLFTGTHFAQVLEGESDAVNMLYDAISRDRRHDDVKIVARLPISLRRFEEWSMAYSGPSQFVARHVNRLLSAPTPYEKDRASEWLTDLMQEFANH